MWELIKLAMRVPPEIRSLAIDLLVTLIGSEPNDIKARRAAAVASRAASEFAIRKALK
jgi:hypothetical protein